MPTTGQFWFLGQGNPTDARLSYTNINAATGSSTNTTVTVRFDNNPTVDLGTGFPEEVQLDTAAGLYYVLSNGGNTGGNAMLLMGHIGSTAAPTVIWTAASIGGDAQNDIVNTIQIDPYSHHLYIGYTEGSGMIPGRQGILDYTYNTTTGAITAVGTNGGYLVKQTQANVQSSLPSATDVFDVRDFALDHTHNFMFFAQETNGDGFESNNIYRIDMNNPTAAAVALVAQSQFPLDNDGNNNFVGNNGFIIDVEVDASTGLVYFDTQSQHPFPDGDYNTALNKIYYISENANGGTATALTLTGLPVGNHFYPGNMQFDAATRQLYVASEETDAGGATRDDVIYVFQLDASGHSAALVNTIAYDNPAMTQDTANLGGMAFNNLAALATLSATTTHAVEQGSRVTLLSAAPTISDIDGGYLASASVRISGGTFSASETSAADDHLSVNNQISGVIAGTNITVAWDSATETLTLTGYDTLAHYQTVLGQVQYNATGNDPTNGGNNTTRTISWQINDGALGDPTGTVNGATTNLRTTTLTIDAVDNPPQINSLGTFNAGSSVTEDAGKRIAFSITDVDGGPGNVTVRLQVLNGTIDIDTAVAGGVAAGGVTGDNTGNVLLTGTLSEINTTLAAATGAVYHSPADYNGADTLTVTTSSGGPQTNVEIRAININAATDIVADSISTTEDNAVTANLITGTNGASADNFEDAGRVISSVTQGAHGAVTFSANGNVTYTPDANYNGADSFSYTVTSGGVTETANVTVTVAAVNDAPTLVAPAALVGQPNVALAITGITFDDVDGAGGSETATFTSTAGNFFAVNGGGVTVTGNSSHTLTLSGTTADLTSFIAGSHLTYSSPSSETIHVILNDNAHTPAPAQDSGAFDIAIVLDTAAVADSTSGSGVEDAPTRIAITLSGSDVDVGDAVDSFTIASLGQHGQLFATANGGPALTAGASIAATGPGPSYTAIVYYQPDADFNGPDSFTYSAFDGEAIGAPATASITVTSIVDIADDTITVTEDSGPNNLGLFGNDTFENSGRAITAVGAAAHGTTAINDNGTVGNLADDFVVYTPNADYTGTDTFSYTVTSGGMSVTETANVNVTVTAVADITADSVTVAEDSGANTLDLLGNDTFENAGRAITAVSTASHGTVAINDNGTAGDATDDFVVYTPDADYVGSDSFTYTVTSNGTTETATASVTVTAVADIVNDTVTLAEDSGARTLDLLGNDSFENAGRAITAVGTAAHGTVSINDNGTAGNLADDFVVYTPNADYNGSDSFTYTVTSNGTTETATVDITVTAVADIANDSATVAEDSGANTLDLLGNDTFENAGRAITAVGAAAHGTVSINDNGTAGNLADDFVVYTPDADYFGADTFTYTVTSGETTETATANITVTAVADIANDNVTVAEGSGSNNLNLLANDSFENPGRAITQVSAAAHGTTAINNNGTPGDATDDFVVYTLAPGNDYNGPDSFTYTVTSNGVIETATVNVTVTPVNDAPVFANLGPGPTFVENGVAVVIDGNAIVSDIELGAGSYGGTTLTLARQGGPDADDVFGATGSLDLTHVNGGGENVSLDNGATFIGTFVNPGDGTFSITFNAGATAALVASVMQQIAYSNASENPPNTVQIDWNFSDGNTGAQGTGGAGVGTGSVTVTVTQVDDAPVLTGVAPTAAYAPGSSGAVLSSALGIFDPDATSPSPNLGLVSATVSIAAGFLAGDELFVNLATSGGHFVTSDGTVTNISVQSNALGTLILSGSDTVPNYQSILDAVSYRSIAADPTNGGVAPNRTITWTVNDGVLDSQTPAPETHLNFDTPPSVDLDGSSAGANFVTTYTENAAPIGIADVDLVIADPDAANAAAATIVLTNAKAGDSLSIAGSLPGGIDSVIDTSVPGQITVHLQNSASFADYQAAVGQIRFSNSSDTPNTTDRDITVTVSGNDIDSNTAHATIHVTAVNDAPVNTIAGSQNALAGLATSIAGVSVSDLDATVLTTSLHVEHGILKVAAVSGGATVGGSGTATVTLTGSAAQIDATLGASNNVVYHSFFDFNGIDHLTMSSNDGGGTGAGGVLVDTDIMNINVAPQIAAYTAGGFTRPALNLDASGHIILEGAAADAAANYGIKFLYAGLPANTPYPPVDPAHADFHLV